MGKPDLKNQRECREIISLFNELFLPTHNTILDHAAGDPLYLPANETHPHHRILFAHEFYASALHEISHWCIAGAERRLQKDLGYWYKPGARTPAEQLLFMQYEAHNQGLEWLLAIASGIEFHVSLDNLDAQIEPKEIRKFAQRVREHASDFLNTGLPPRAEVLRQALCERYDTAKHFRQLGSQICKGVILPAH